MMNLAAQSLTNPFSFVSRTISGVLRGLGIAAWFTSRDRREQFLIVIGSVVVALYLGYVGIYKPVSKWRSQALDQIATYEAITARVTANGSNISETLDEGQKAPDASVITDSANAVGLVIRRLEPEGSLTSIELEEADFSVLVDWLAVLEEHDGLKVASIELDRRPAPGVVSARISVGR